MLQLQKGIDILTDLGGVKTIDQAKVVFKQQCDQKHLAKLNKINQSGGVAGKLPTPLP